MANTLWHSTALTGGAADALDAIAYASINDDDVAITCLSSVFYIHKFDSSSSAAESSPDTIKPDDSGTSTGRWILQNAYDDNLDHDALTNFAATEHKTSATIRGESGTAIVLETRTSDPGSPVAGQIWLRTDL